MSAKSSLTIQIDPIHSRAICEEIGERLRDMLQRHGMPELPSNLQRLMQRLAEADDEISPSIAPSLEDIIDRGPIDAGYQPLHS
jgi:predicted transcriptional regulator